MSRRPIEEVLESLDTGVEPRPEFRQMLAERLLTEFEAVKQVGSSPGPTQVRPRRSIFSHRRPLVAVIAAVTVTVMLAGVLVLARPQSALAIMVRAQDAFADAPPFHAELSRFLRGDNGGLIEATQEFPEYTGKDWISRQELWYGGSRGWRREILEDTLPVLRGGAGSFMVFDGRRTGVFYVHDLAGDTYRDQTNIFYEVAGEDAQFSPLLELSPEPNGGMAKYIATRTGGEAMSFRKYFDERCRVGSDGEVAGRRADHLVCEGGFQELWLDAETGLILRHVTPETRHEVTTIEYNPRLAQSIFDFEPPAGARRVDLTASVSKLAVGEPVPDWAAPLLSGGVLRLGELKGKPVAVYLWATWCEPCVGRPLEMFNESWQVFGERIQFVAVAVNDRSDSVQAHISQSGYSVPVVIDERGKEVAEKWLMDGIPHLVLIDAEGHVRGLYAGRISARDLRRVLEALAAGEPIPKVEPQK